MKNMVKIKKSVFIKRNGFTLIEILVAVSLFSFTILSATGLFKSVMDGQRSALASQNIQESMRYAFEVMSKEIRMAQASDGTCKTLFNPQPTPTNKVYNTTTDAGGNQILYFKNQNDECVVYYLTNKRINIIRNYNTGAITSASIKINSLKFFVIDNAIGSSNSLQPRVTISVEAVFDEGRSTRQKINIQTSVSSRSYE